ncbi:uncharacterized protein BDFB_004424, partial [Asbolus verrucosus]
RKFTMSQTEWLTKSPRWTPADYKEILLAETDTQPTDDLNLTTIIERSSKFDIPFPTETVRCNYLKRKIAPEELHKNINSAYPVIHEQALLLCAIFLDYQRKFGNIEFYKDMTLLQFIDRLLDKRAVAFVGSSDHYLLLNKVKGSGNWESVGTPDETPPLTLETCLSYDEIKLSALLSVSSHSYFINDGARNNYGEYETKRQKVEEKGVIIGLIGARLEKENVMEYREIMKTKEQNNERFGYGKIIGSGVDHSAVPTLQGKFLEFYGDDNASYDELLNKLKSSPDRYIDMDEGAYFDKLMFERRIALSIDTLLIEANARAREEGKKAYIHVVGLGLGVWKICRDQDKIFLDTFAKRLETLKDMLTDVSDVRFAYIRHNMAGPYKNGDRVNGIKIHIENKNPQEKLRDADEGKLLVVSYPWDGNALPGNEFWLGPENLAASGDPAAAASSQIAELHNCHINDKVRARNLRIATLQGLVTFQEYQDIMTDGWLTIPPQWIEDHKSILFQFYKDVSLVELIDRLLSKRAVAFLNCTDDYLLLDGSRGSGNWEKIGTSNETPPLTLRNCLSYDEIKLSALLSVSSHTCFINDGNRYNYGKVEENLQKIEENGVIIGLIGARMEKEKVMEYREIIKTRDQNIQKYGYGDTQALQGKVLDFYGDDNAIYSELLNKLKSSPERYIDLGGGEYFDKLMFERRIALSIDTLLIEANDRAKKEEKKAFIHVVGLGLGVWKIWSGQNEIFMNTFAKRLEFLKTELANVSDVCFAHIRHNMMGPYKHGDELNGIKIHINNRNPHEKLKGADEGKLLVVSYAWDGNALPGNEFWLWSLAGSGDPAAASSTQVAELHNYHINGKVRGSNLRVATLKNGIQKSDDWLTTSPHWTGVHKSILLSVKNIDTIPDLTLSEIVKNSSEFPRKFPIDSVRCSQLQTRKSEKILEKNINSAYPVIHEQALFLVSLFLAQQIESGKTQFYKDMSLVGLIDRLLSKRAVMFVGSYDYYLLLNGLEGAGGWENVGTTKEKPPLTLEECLSYDEMKLSALLSVSSHTCFINDGSRKNAGKINENLEEIEESGVIIGLIGTRLRKKNVMEYNEIMKTKEQNIHKHGYGKSGTFQQKVLEFYGDINATYNQISKILQSSPERYVDLQGGNYFDMLMYERRISLSIDTLLIEANDRAKKEGKTAFVHVVGLGLGVWKIWSGQDKIFMDTFAKRLEFLSSELANVSDVCFAYIQHDLMGSYKDGDKMGEITIHIRNKNPQEKLNGDHEGKLLVVSYAWDGNALPGNEFWMGNLTTSSDPAAASSTQVAELHNYHINRKIRGSNLRVATLKNGIVTTDSVPNLKLAEIMENSSKFPIPFPIQTVRCAYLKTRLTEQLLEKNINSAYPVIHEEALRLCAVFLVHQSKLPNRMFYENMSLLQFVDRLLSKRAVMFVGAEDHYLLLNGRAGAGNWESVGATNEKPPLTLDGCLSYDEIKLSALLSVSSHTCFINDGNRNNRGEFETNRRIIEENGVVIGLTGARLEKENVMEYKEVMKTREQNNTEYGYGDFKTPTLQGQFLNFYGDCCGTYQKLLDINHLQSSRFVHLGGGKYFDKLMFERRIALSIDTLLIDANDRAKKEKRKAFVHVVGLGLGVWKICQEQDKIFMDTFAKRLQLVIVIFSAAYQYACRFRFFKKRLTNVTDVCFAYISHKMADGYKNGDELNGITIHIHDRNPHDKLTGVDQGKLLIVSYAWDGNAFPGNEFWAGHLTSSGDPAAACSTQIAELHNYYINRK